MIPAESLGVGRPPNCSGHRGIAFFYFTNSTILLSNLFLF